MTQESTLPTQAADVLSRFESLGGRLQGCEFGLVQRAAGIEPLGLLRWTELYCEELIAALDCDFAGVGAPEHTVIFPAHWGSPTEWITRDKRFGMTMHTDLWVAQVSEAEACRRACQRLVFLVRKMLEDLQTGEKIFVFRETTDPLSETQQRRLHRSVRRHGGASLLVAAYGHGLHPAGSVRQVEPGLYIGYFDHFRISPVYQPLADVNEVWLEVCRNTLALETERRARSACYRSGPHYLESRCIAHGLLTEEAADPGGRL
jgi:hypothetical protein